MKHFAVSMLMLLLCSASTISAQEQRPLNDLERELLEQLPGDEFLSPSSVETNPIRSIADDMTLVVGELAKLATGKPTQQQQQAIVERLDRLIEQLDKECEACRRVGSSSSNPNRPLADSVIVGGPGGIGDLHAPRPDGKAWGQLPPHQRERILQSQENGFPAHYQRILERYYRRVAEERPVTGAAAETPKGNE